MSKFIERLKDVRVVYKTFSYIIIAFEERVCQFGVLKIFIGMRLHLCLQIDYKKNNLLT